MQNRRKKRLGSSKRLAEAGQTEAALRVARALLRLWDHGGQLASLFGRHMYEHHLPSIADALTASCGKDGLRLLIDLFCDAGTISRQFSYSHHSYRPIDNDEMAAHDGPVRSADLLEQLLYDVSATAGSGAVRAGASS